MSHPYSQKQKLLKKNKGFQLMTNESNTSTMKSDDLEQKSQSLGHTGMQTLHTPHTNTSNTPGTTTNTTLPNREGQPNLSNLQKTEQRTPLPGPSIPTSEKSNSAGDDVPGQPPSFAVADVVDPGALSPAHERKAQQLAQTYAQVGILVLGFNETAGKIIYISAIDRAREVLRVARHHPAMMKAIDQIIDGNDYVTAILGHASMLGMILALNNILPPSPVTTMMKQQGMQSLYQWDMLQQAINGMQNANSPAAAQPKKRTRSRSKPATATSATPVN